MGKEVDTLSDVADFLNEIANFNYRHY